MPTDTGVDERPIVLLDTSAAIALVLEDHDAHPLVTSSVFHYEFECVHRFTDGSGRMGRLWQSLFLARWKVQRSRPWRAWEIARAGVGRAASTVTPVESLVFDHQAEHYLDLEESPLADGGALITDGGALITNDFEGTATFGTNDLTSAGSLDVFVARIGADGAW